MSGGPVGVIWGQGWPKAPKSEKKPWKQTSPTPPQVVTILGTFCVFSSKNALKYSENASSSDFFAEPKKGEKKELPRGGLGR